MIIYLHTVLIVGIVMSVVCYFSIIIMVDACDGVHVLSGICLYYRIKQKYFDDIVDISIKRILFRNFYLRDTMR